MGAVIAEELNGQNLEFLIIERNEEKVDLIKGKGFLCIKGDAKSEKTIQDSQINKVIGVSFE